MRVEEAADSIIRHCELITPRPRHLARSLVRSPSRLLPHDFPVTSFAEHTRWLLCFCSSPVRASGYFFVFAPVPCVSIYPYVSCSVFFSCVCLSPCPCVRHGGVRIACGDGDAAGFGKGPYLMAGRRARKYLTYWTTTLLAR